MTLVSGLFSSWATPATSCPMADSFSAWRSCACVDLRRSSAAIERAFASASSSLICCRRRLLRMSSVTFFATSTTDEIVLPRTLHGDANLARNHSKQTLVRRLEAAWHFGAHGQRAEQFVSAKNRHGQRAQCRNGSALIARQQRSQVIDNQRRARS